MARSHEERLQQSAFMRWVRLQSAAWPQLKWMHHIPNGEYRTPTTAAILAGLGVKKGVWDIFWPCPRHGYAGVYIEFKRKKGGRLSKEQREFAQDHDGVYFFAAFNDWEQAREFVCAWLREDAAPVVSVQVH